MKLIELTPQEFALLAKVIYERTGIHLPESKRTLLSNRLRRRVRALDLKTFTDYHDLLCDPVRYQNELPHFLSAVTTNETYFYRNERLWKFICEEWIPRIAEAAKKSEKKSVRVWSAASSSGEEAYTTAICLREHLPNLSAWKVKIIGTDISERVLDRARKAEYNDYAMSKTTSAIRAKWFEESDGVFTLKPKVRGLVDFQFHNLRDPFRTGKFDLVFLRNVLMYFDLDMKKRVLKNVIGAMAPGACLVVGDVDPIRNTPELAATMTLDYEGPNLYRKPAKSLAGVGAGHSKG